MPLYWGYGPVSARVVILFPMFVRQKIHQCRLAAHVWSRSDVVYACDYLGLSTFLSVCFSTAGIHSLSRWQ